MDKIAFRIKTEVAERGGKPEAPKPVVISTSEATAQDPEAPIGENATNKPKPRRVRRGSFINQWRT
jgi:hypothetical protein